METPVPDTRRSTAATVLVMVCTAASRLFGYARTVLISIYFGDAGAVDAMNAVFNIPNTLRKLFAEGAFSSAFIPVLSTTLTEDPSGGRARELVRSLVAFQLLVLLPLVGLSLAFPRAFVGGLLRFSDPLKVNLGITLMRWMFNYILLISLGALVMAILNTHGHFAVPALSPLMFTLATVLAIFFFHNELGVVAQGVGVFVGGILQLACQLPALRRRGYRLVPRLAFNNPDFRRTAALWAPYIASASIAAINQYIAVFFASGLEDGSVTAVYNAIMYLQIPLGIFMASVTTVLFPRMSREAAESDPEALRRTVSYGIQAIIVLLVPSTVLLCLFGREIIAATIQRGQFRPEGTLRASLALTGYALGLVSMGLYTLLQKLFNSFKSFSVPVLSAGVIAVIDISLSIVLIRTPLRVSGLAYANSLSFTAGMAVLFFLALRRLGALGMGSILITLGKSLLGSLPMAAILVGFHFWQPELWRRGGAIGPTALIAAVAAGCVALTVLMYLVLRMPFLADILRRRRKP